MLGRSWTYILKTNGSIEIAALDTPQVTGSRSGRRLQIIRKRTAKNKKYSSIKKYG